jgi:hypothetical protein
MTAIFVQATAKSAWIAADTLTTASDRLECGRRSKVLSFPHLGMVVAGAGSTCVVDAFARFLQDGRVRDLDDLAMAPAVLRQQWREWEVVRLATQRSVVNMVVAVDGVIHTFQMESPDFELKAMGSYIRVAMPSFDRWAEVCGLVTTPEQCAQFIARQRHHCPDTHIGKTATVTRIDADGTITAYPMLHVPDVVDDTAAEVVADDESLSSLPAQAVA